MCYKKPGPRCSAHAKAALVEAYKSKEPEKMQKALYDYLHSPAGIAETEMTDPAYAKTLEFERQNMINELMQQELNDSDGEGVRDETYPVENYQRAESEETEIPKSPGFTRQALGQPVVGREAMVNHVQTGAIQLGKQVNLQLDDYYGQKFEVTGWLQKESNSDRIFVLDNSGNEYEVYSSMNNNYTPHVFTGFKYVE